MATAGGQRHYRWLENPTYSAVHRRMHTTKGRAADHPCVSCARPAHQWAYTGEDPDERLESYWRETRGYHVVHRFSLNPDFYVAMCRKCHTAKDKAAAREELAEYRLWKYRTGLTLEDVTPKEKASA